MLDAHLAFGWGWQLDIFQLQNFRAAGLMNTDGLGHEEHLTCKT